MVIFKRSAIESIGGWFEIESWGTEDNMQSIKVEHFLTYKEMPYRSFHLYHQKQEVVSELYKKNFQMLQEIAKMPKENLRNVMMNEWFKCGSLNKYSN